HPCYAERYVMYVQLSAVIIDADSTNRQELANFLTGFGLSLVAQLPSTEQLPSLLGRPDSPQVVIVNLDPGAHESLKQIGHRPRHTIGDVMDSAEKVDKQLLDNALTIHKGSGVAILARPDMPEDTQRVNQPGVHRLLNVLGRIFDHVVIDSIMSIDPIYSTAI